MLRCSACYSWELLGADRDPFSPRHVILFGLGRTACHFVSVCLLLPFPSVLILAAPIVLRKVSCEFWLSLQTLDFSAVFLRLFKFSFTVAEWAVSFGGSFVIRINLNIGWLLNFVQVGARNSHHARQFPNNGIFHVFRFVFRFLCWLMILW